MRVGGGRRRRLANESGREIVLFVLARASAFALNPVNRRWLVETRFCGGGRTWGMPIVSASTTLRPEERERKRWGQPLRGVDGRMHSWRGMHDDEWAGNSPRGPRVTPTASATMSMPSWIFMRDFMSKVSCLASARTLRVAPRTRTARVARGLVTLPARAWSIEGGWDERRFSRRSVEKL